MRGGEAEARCCHVSCVSRTLKGLRHLFCLRWNEERRANWKVSGQRKEVSSPHYGVFGIIFRVS